MTRHAAGLCWSRTVGAERADERDRVAVRDFESGPSAGSVLVVGFGARNLGVPPPDSPRVAGESRFDASVHEGASGDDRMGRAY